MNVSIRRTNPKYARRRRPAKRASFAQRYPRGRRGGVGRSAFPTARRAAPVVSLPSRAFRLLGKGPYPPSQTVKLRWAHISAHTAPTGTGSVYTTFSANGAFQPYPEIGPQPGSADNPRGFGAMAAVYGQYQVLASKITLYPIPTMHITQNGYTVPGWTDPGITLVDGTGTGTGAHSWAGYQVGAAVAPAGSIVVLSLTDNPNERETSLPQCIKNADTKLWSPVNPSTGSGMKKKTAKFSAARFFRTKDETGYKVNTGTVPDDAHTAFWQLQTFNSDPSNPVDMRYIVQIDYVIRFTEPKPLTD